MPQLPPELEPAYIKFANLKKLRDDNLITVDEFKKGYEEFVAAGAKLGVTISIYDAANERNPAYPVGNNSNRNGFTYTAAHPKFKIFQNVMKPATIVAINKWHKWISAKWDKDAFVYDDPRMQCLDTKVHGLIDELFDHEQRKLDFVHKGADIMLFYMKEDSYYSGRVFALLNRLPYFVLKQCEADNINTFTEGVGSMDMFTGTEAK
jgi:hypothetical protein